MVEEQDEETTFSPTNSLKEHLNFGSREPSVHKLWNTFGIWEFSQPGTEFSLGRSVHLAQQPWGNWDWDWAENGFYYAMQGRAKV